MQKLVDLLKTMFGDLDLEDVNPEQLETDAIKALHQKATEAEEAAILAKHGPIPADKIRHITITSVPIPIEFGIPEASLPKTENVKMPSTRNLAKKVTHFYYCCRICSHSSQNKCCVAPLWLSSLNPFIEFRIRNNSSSSDVLYIQASISISPKYESK